MVMETYYRKRSRRALQSNPVTEMEPLAEQGGVNDAGKSLLSGRHHLVPPPPASDHCADLLLKGSLGFGIEFCEREMCAKPHLLIGDEKDEGDMQKHIQVGALYEIDHIHLPPRTPVQLRSVRVAMVCEKTKLNVEVRFPSMESLEAFFSYSRRETHPALDEKFVMGLALSEKVLSRLVSAEKFAEKRCSENFWLISSSVGLFRDKQDGYCLSELKGNGMVKWGIRRQVKYLGRHKGDGDDDNGGKINAQNSSSSFVNGFEEKGMELSGGGADKRESSGEEEGHEESDTDVIKVEEIVKEEEDQDKGEGEEDTEDNIEEDEDEDKEEEEEDEEEEEEEEKIPEAEWNLKRKRYSSRNISKKKRKNEIIKTKNRKQVEQKKNQVKRNKNGIRFKEARVLRNPKDRWSAERYKLAEQNLLEVMKVKGARAEKPILRPQLRTEARKRIGDTGLLDHLLKHMAGKLAPGGKERFRRRHNADGAMEYWLESADLVNVRRDAGITDPYWVPPPGWKPGDSPTQDPICANEIKLLKDDISQIKRDHLKLVATKKQLQEEIVKLRREVDELSSQRKLEGNQSIALISSGSGNIGQKLDQLAVKLVPPKCDLDKPPVSMEMLEEQLMGNSDFVKELEKKIGKLMTPNEEERERTNFPLIAPPDEFKTEKVKTKNKQPEVHEISTVGDERSDFREKPAFISSPSADQKAAKIERLKSGFRICKPQGTFLWPNMVKNYSAPCANTLSPQPDQVLVQVDVPTPPSVSSSTASAPPQLPYQHLLHPSPPVKPFAERGAVAVSLPTLSKGTNLEDVGANIFSTTTVINLKNVSKSPNHAIPLMSTAANIKIWEGCVYGARNAVEYVQKQQNACCSSSASSLASEVGNWLALSAPKSGLSDD